jgi:hypothetical protein
VFASIVQFCTFLTKLGHLGALRRRKLGGLHSRVNGVHVAFVLAWLGQRKGGHCKDAIHGVLLECAGSSVRRSVVMHEYAGQERSIN